METKQKQLVEEFNKIILSHKVNLSNIDATRTENSFISENNPTEGALKAEYQGILSGFRATGQDIISRLENEVSGQITLLKGVDSEKYFDGEKRHICIWNLVENI